MLEAFAAAARTAYEGRRLSGEAEEGRALATVDEQRTALLAAVGHDLRTPLAGIKASVSTLRQTDVEWSDEERQELLATIEDSADRLDAVVGNLLDASRLQAGAARRQERGGGAGRRRRRRDPEPARGAAARSTSRSRRICPRSSPIAACFTACSSTSSTTRSDTGAARSRSASRLTPAPRAPSSRSSTTGPGFRRDERRRCSARSRAPTIAAAAALAWASRSRGASSRRWTARWPPTRPRAAA